MSVSYEHYLFIVSITQTASKIPSSAITELDAMTTMYILRMDSIQNSYKH